MPCEGGPPSAVASADEINDSKFDCSIFLSLAGHVPEWYILVMFNADVFL